MNHLRLLTTALIILCCLCAPVHALDIPEPLKPWKNWVLHEHEEQRCPAHFDSGELRRCWWPSHLSLDVSASGGLFNLHVTVYAPSWVVLPGDDIHWPEWVSVEGERIPVTNQNGFPVIRLEPGQFQITGAFVWETLPDILQVPATTGILRLTIDNREVDEPDIDSFGRLRLNEDVVPTRQEDTLTATLFRLIEDALPIRVATHLRLRVSGRTRQIRLQDLLPENATVMELDTPLPARLADDGDLIVQAKPGHWDLRITARLPGPVHKLSMGKGRYGEEIWSFKAANHLRMVRISGAPSVEPSRTRMPDAWKGFPAYLLEPGATLSFQTIRRGDPDPAPNRLNLERSWWLDFDGSGFTVQDRIHGTMSQAWYLSMAAPMELGRVSVDGKDQLITLQGEKPSPGVQLRRGKLFLEAASRLLRTSSLLPAIGWEHDFQQVNGVLHLPPGWSLFSTANVDAPPAAWLQQWSLLDVFLVLIIAVGTYQVYDRKIGLLALVTLVLIFHEPGAPRHIWLLLLAVTALVKYLPAGWFKTGIKLLGAASVIALIITALPFMIQQVRTAIYPQLEKPEETQYRRFKALDAEKTVFSKMEALSEAVSGSNLAGERIHDTLDEIKPPGKQSISRPKRFVTDPDALIQTGPGLPTWRWKSMNLRWNGPVDRTQQIHLWLISPPLNLFLGLARVVLLFVLILFFCRPFAWRDYLSGRFSSGTALTIIAMSFLLPAQTLRAEAVAENFPPQRLLEELRQRLLEPPACLPHCADVNRLELTATPDQLLLTLQVHAMAETAVPLPAARDTWRPNTVTMNNEPVRSLARDKKGRLWMVLPKGIHLIKMTGMAGQINEIRISFPILPHQSTYAGVGWQARGFRKDGKMDPTVVLTRVQQDQQSAVDNSKIDIPAFFHVTRTLQLGIQWEVATRIQRVTAPKDPVLLSIPLLQNAALTTAGIETKEGFAQIPMGPEQTETSFSSTIPVSPKISLTAPVGVAWVETWILDVSPIWNASLAGLSVAHHQDTEQNWQPRWRPWPGEKITIHVTKPRPVPGRTVTIDRVRLDLTPGQRISRAKIAMEIRSSQGGDHQIELPDQANLQEVRVKGKKLPIRQDGQRVTIPLTPGRQKVEVGWHQLTGSRLLIQSPRINVGDKAVNTSVTFHMPDQRWLLFAGGPRLGPAVLFWSYGIVVLVVAIGLGRTQFTLLGTSQWILLGLGLTQVPVIIAIVIAGWLLALGYRDKIPAPRNPALFNLTQILTVVLTLAALAGLYIAIERGLLGIPDMQIAGNHSTRLQLNWTQDRIDASMPTPWVVSLPLWAYRILMLAWSLWLAFSLVSWLKWGWRCFSKEHLWKPIRWRRGTKPSMKEEP